MRKLLKNYLDGFCYKLNRRYFGERLFDRLIIASIQPYSTGKVSVNHKRKNKEQKKPITAPKKAWG
jgi:hypothetical protein